MAKKSMFHAERVFCQLRDTLAEKSGSLQNIWDRCDTDAEGQLSKREFQRFLRKIGFHMSDLELKRLLSFPELKLFRSRGKIDFATIRTQLLNSTFKEGDRIILKGKNSKNEGMKTLTFVDAAEAIQQFEYKLNYQFKEVRKAFQRVDSNKDGKISLFEFRSLFAHLGITIMDEEFEKITPAYMKFFNRAGCLEYDVVKNKFERPVAGTSISLRPRLKVYVDAEAAIVTLSQNVSRKHKSTTRAFRQVDANHDGHITDSEFRQFLSLLNIDLVDIEYERMLDLLGIRTELRRNGLNTTTFQQTLVRAASFGLPTKNRVAVAPNDAKSPPSRLNPTAKVSAHVAVGSLRVILSRKYNTVQKMFRAVDTDHDGVVSEQELIALLNKANLSVSKPELKKFLAKARKYEAPGGGWRFQNFCDFVFARAITNQIVKEPKVSRVGALPDINAMSPAARRRAAAQGKRLLAGELSPEPQSQTTKAAVARLRRKQESVEKKKVANQLRLKTKQRGISSDVLERACLLVYPVWKRLRATFKKATSSKRGSAQGQGLCEPILFCRILQRQAGVSDHDGSVLARAFYEDRGTADGVHFGKFLKAIVSNFVTN